MTPHQKAANLCRVLAESFEMHEQKRFCPPWRWAELERYVEKIRDLALKCNIPGAPPDPHPHVNGIVTAGIYQDGRLTITIQNPETDRYCSQDVRTLHDLRRLIQDYYYILDTSCQKVKREEQNHD